MLCTFAVALFAGAARAAAAAANDDEAVAAPATETVRLQLRVIDTAGRPVSGASVRVLKLASKERTATQPVAEYGDAPAVTGPDGRFRTPHPLPAGTAYVAEIESEGYGPGLSRWTRPADRVDVGLPDVVLRKLVTVAGRVVDRAGWPIAGVRVFQSGDGPEPTESITDADGRFRLAGLAESGAFLFAEKDGFRFHGQRVDARDGVGDIILEIRDGPTQRVLRPIGLARPSIPEAQARAWAERVRDERFEQIAAGKAPDHSFIFQLSSTRPELLLDRLDELALAFPDLSRPREQFLNWAARGIAERDFDEAMALSRLVNRASIGARGGSNMFLLWNEQLGPAAKLAALSEGALIARQMSDVRSRIAYLTSFASLLLDAAQYDEAKWLLDEVERHIALLPPEASARRVYRARLAVAWSRRDLPKARSLVYDADADVCVLLATALARKNPAEAERMLNDAVRLAGSDRLVRIARRDLPAICYEVALSEPERAERIAQRVLDPALRPELVRALSSPAVLQDGQITPDELKEQLDLLFRKAFVYGLIAEAVARTDPEKARSFLETAVAIVHSLRHGSYEDGSELFFVTPALVLSALLPVAEQIDPAWAQELFWRTLAIRLPPPDGESERRQMHDFSLGFLALMLSRHDREVAMGILRPVLEREQSRAFNGTLPYHWAATVCPLIDPDEAARWIETLPDEPDEHGLSPRTRGEVILSNLYTAPKNLAVIDPEDRLQANLRLVRQTCQIYVNTQDE